MVSSLVLALTAARMAALLLSGLAVSGSRALMGMICLLAAMVFQFRTKEAALTLGWTL